MEPVKKRMLISTIAIGTAVLSVLAVFWLASPRVPDARTTPGVEATLPGAGAEPYVLDEVGPEVPTLVEYLDFQCPSCAALHPTVTALRVQYEGKINFVVRQFPLPGHPHAMDAALAAEAAGQQGRFEDMYSKLFENHDEWAAEVGPQAGTFRNYAEELGLDLAAYDAAIEDPATSERIQADIDDARRAGAQGTPTFVLDGEVLQLQEVSDLTDALDSA